MSKVDDYVEHVIGKEGRYSDHPSDRGGKTMWGITEKVARDNGYTGAMHEMSRGRAVEIYKRQYIQKPGFLRVAALSDRIALELIDTGVNMGPAIPTMALQRLLNALNRQGVDFPDIGVDGSIAKAGNSATINALTKFLALRGKDGEIVMLRGLNCLQGERYVDLCEKRPPNEDFMFGWLLNRVGV